MKRIYIKIIIYRIMRKLIIYKVRKINSKNKIINIYRMNIKNKTI